MAVHDIAVSEAFAAGVARRGIDDEAQVPGLPVPPVSACRDAAQALLLR